jgi:ATP-dependent Clp protease ATP-binding subunit ClpA
VDDFDIAPSKIGESAQRVVDRAVEESRRRDHVELTNEHVFLAFTQVEWDTFAQVMCELELNPHEILRRAGGSARCPAVARRVANLRVAGATKLVFKLAFHQASRDGRQTIESSDLFSAIFEESQGFPLRSSAVTAWNQMCSRPESTAACGTTSCAKSVSASVSSCRLS